ncbi:CRISPR system Cascade subunit CasA [Azospirillum soli]|nr:CRISPR system Cascade subunit CasA [Azospirillum soli]
MTEDRKTPLRVLGNMPDGGLARLEFLIGAVQQLMAPETGGDWLDGYFDPPAPERLGSIIDESGLAPHFDLFGATPAFQDTSVAGEAAQGVSALFLLQPGEQTRSRNQDIWGKDIGAVGIPAAMEALYALQIYSPAGGRGARTSPSGGGPLRTFLTGDTLWTKVWSNILLKPEWEALGNKARDITSLIPWIDFRVDAPTPLDAPSSHLFWACPRRVLLSTPDDGTCEITGQPGPVVREIRMAAYGPDYKSDLWRHPLSPYYRLKKGGTVQRLPRLGGAVAFGVSWRDYVGMFQEKGEAGEAGVEPAMTVRAWRQERASDTGQETVRLQVFGYRCDNAKVLGTVSAAMPFLAVPPSIEVEFSGIVENVVDGTGSLASTLKRQTLLAQFDPKALENVPLSYGNQIEADFWARTESHFRSFAKRVRDHLVGGGAPNDQAVMDLLSGLHGAVGQAAVHLFDDRINVGQTDNPERVVTARRNLLMAVHGAPIRRAFGLPVDDKVGTKTGGKTKAKQTGGKEQVR